MKMGKTRKNRCARGLRQSCVDEDQYFMQFESSDDPCYGHGAISHFVLFVWHDHVESCGSHEVLTPCYKASARRKLLPENCSPVDIPEL